VHRYCIVACFLLYFLRGLVVLFSTRSGVANPPLQWPQQT